MDGVRYVFIKAYYAAGNLTKTGAYAIILRENDIDNLSMNN